MYIATWINWRSQNLFVWYGNLIWRPDTRQTTIKNHKRLSNFDDFSLESHSWNQRRFQDSVKKLLGHVVEWEFIEKGWRYLKQLALCKNTSSRDCRQVLNFTAIESLIINSSFLQIFVKLRWRKNFIHFEFSSNSSTLCCRENVRILNSISQSHSCI